MKKFIIEEPIFEIFPEVKIGVIVCRGIDNTVKDKERYADYLANAQVLAQEHSTWSDADSWRLVPRLPFPEPCG